MKSVLVVALVIMIVCAVALIVHKAPPRQYARLADKPMPVVREVPTPVPPAQGQARVPALHGRSRVAIVGGPEGVKVILRESQ